MTLHPNRIKPNGNRLNGDTGMKIFALTWRGIKLVAALLLAVIGILNVYVALTGREPATETTV